LGFLVASSLQNAKEAAKSSETTLVILCEWQNVVVQERDRTTHLQVSTLVLVWTCATPDNSGHARTSHRSIRSRFDSVGPRTRGPVDTLTVEPLAVQYISLYQYHCSSRLPRSGQSLGKHLFRSMQRNFCSIGWFFRVSDDTFHALLSWLEKRLMLICYQRKILLFH
jgi:hypothetical protein